MNGSAGTYVKDHHGNIIGGRSKSSTMFADKDNCMEYDAFGNKRNKNIPAPFGYCGEYTDAESGLVYLRNRYYDTTTGRFITEDPAKDGLNWYSYCANNPVVLVDPSGLSSVPRDLDWDEDGKIDSKADRHRFDSDNNGVADWIEAGYTNANDWYADKTYNILQDFPFSQQNSDYLCWANDIAMITEWFTGCKFDETGVAKQVFGNKDYEKGRTIPQIIGILREKGFLSNSGYEVANKPFNKRGYTESQIADFIKKEIDGGRPMITNVFTGHVVVIVGYDYSDPNHKIVIMNDSNDDKSYQTELSVNDFVVPETGSYNINQIIYFKRTY